MTLQALTRRRGIIITMIIVAAVFAWSPWLTGEYATTAVVQSLGGPDQEYNYLGDLVPLSDVPKSVIRIPFGALVYFPSEAMFTVTFWGQVV